MYIKILILFLVIQSNSCVENQFLDCTHIYYNGRYGVTNVFSNEHSNIRPAYQLSDAGVSKARTKAIGHFLCNGFYTSQIPYIFLNKEDILWYLQKYDSYISYDDEDDPCPIQSFKGIFFIEPPHCGDLAWCIRQSEDFNEEDNLLKLLDASYEVQKLVHCGNETFPKMSHFVHFRTETMSLINKFLTKTFSQYTFQNYRSNVQEIFFQAIFSYFITIIENLMILFLIYNQKLPAYVQYPVFGIFILLKTRIAISLQDACMNLSHLITIFCIIGLEAGLFNDMIYYCEKIFYYQKILSVCWIIHSSFFLTMLYYKYSKFKKVMNNYEDHYKVIALLNEEKMRDKKIILL